MHASAVTEPRTKRWTREEFYCLAEQGYFKNNKRVLLLDGEIFEMSPQGAPHSNAAMYLTHWAVGAFGKDYLVRVQMPLNATEYSDPEPDVAIIPRRPEGYVDHPETAVLIIEVSDSSLALDRRKAKTYAQANVPEYWIVNIPEKQIEVHRNPNRDEMHYADRAVFKAGQRIAPHFRPVVELDVTELFK